MRRSPERELIDDYLTRARKSGASLGIRSFDDIEVESGGGVTREGERLLAKIPSGSDTLRLDERGAPMRSTDLAQHIARLRDDGRNLTFLIGGADGYSDAVVSAMPRTMSLGAFTWPHKLARVMLAEQVYRSMTILAGTPYHKD